MNLNKFRDFLHNHPNIVSFFHTLITELLWDAGVSAAAGQIITGGDWSKTAWGVLGYSIFRTVLRVGREQAKKLFPKKDE